MLQYTVQLPPLSLSNSKHSKSNKLQQQHLRDVSDDPSIRNNASSISSSLINSAKRAHHSVQPARPAYPALSHHPHALSISTALSNNSSTRSSSSASPSPSITSPSFFSKPIPRSPLVASSRPLPSPLPRPSPHPLKTPLPSVEEYGSTLSNYGASTARTATTRSSRRSSMTSSTAVDVLTKGDLIGEGLALQGEIIRSVDLPSASSRIEASASEFEVFGRLGTGSYATVYHVREVLYRAPASDDGHCGVAAAGRLELEDGSSSGCGSGGRASVEYGKEYAVKLLSRANLDEDGLDTQQLEATIHQSLRPHPNIVTLHRTFETPSYLLLLLEFVPGEDLFYFLEQARDHYDSDPALSTSPGNDSSSSEESYSSSSSARTPPTPSLLSSLNPNKLLSKTRLKLIASMFSQMCEAVASCHDQRVFHRDIKPENFIVTDGWSNGEGDQRVRKVIVKLTDFGLSTVDVESGDMDVGSAPYMSYECRNNVHPTYSPRAADVWSLGIVLINMLYHYNPWTDTTEGVCQAFEMYRQGPVHFFMTRFTGMTLPVAEFLANKVFCILKVPNDDSQRISARQFGIWIKDLPTLLGQSSSAGASGGHSRNASISSTMGYRIASIPHSRRPSRRPSSTRPGSSAGMAHEVLGLGIGLGGISQRASRTLSRAPSLGPNYEDPVEETGELSTVIDQENEMEAEAEIIETDSRCASTHKRRKRGRKGKGVVQPTIVAAPSNEPNIVDKTLTTLAEASQALARELSRTSRNPSQPSVTTSAASIHSSAATTTNIIYSPLEQTSNVALQSPLVQVPSSSSLTSSLKAGVTSSTVSAPSPLSSSVTNIPIPHSIPLSSSSSTSGIINANSPLPPPPVPAAQPTPTITKKPSKWRLGFGKGSHGQSDRSSVSSKSSSLQAQSPVEQIHHPHLANGSSKPMSTTASNVTNLLMGLNPSTPTSKASSSSHVHNTMPPPSLPASSSVASLEETSSIWQRGRKPKVIGGGSAPRNVGAGSTTWGPSGASSAFGVTSSTSSLVAGGMPPPLPNGNGPYGHGGAHMNHSSTSWGPPSNGSHSNLSVLQKERAQSPTSLRSGRHGVASSAASVVSSSSAAAGISSNGASSSTSNLGGGSGMKEGGGAARNSDWRASMSSLGGVSTMSGSSAFTRLSNGSQRSVSTAATSVSASSWRSNGSKYPYSYETGGQLPPNVKLVTGTPWELDQLPRQMYANPDDVRFGSPPVRKRRAKQKDPKLDTINEWSGQKQQQQQQQHGSSPLAQRQDAMTSTTGLDGDASGEPGDGAAGANGTSPRKVQKGQINALAKMLSALRR